jgi:hypothetical protein
MLPFREAKEVSCIKSRVHRSCSGSPFIYPASPGSSFSCLRPHRRLSLLLLSFNHLSANRPSLSFLKPVFNTIFQQSPLIYNAFHHPPPGRSCLSRRGPSQHFASNTLRLCCLQQCYLRGSTVSLDLLPSKRQPFP